MGMLPDQTCLTRQVSVTKCVSPHSLKYPRLLQCSQSKGHSLKVSFTFQHIKIEVVSQVPGRRDSITHMPFCFPAGLFIEEAACLQLLKQKSQIMMCLRTASKTVPGSLPPCLWMPMLSGCESSGFMGVMQLWPSPHIAVFKKHGFLCKEDRYSRKQGVATVCDYKVVIANSLT